MANIISLCVYTPQGPPGIAGPKGDRGVAGKNGEQGSMVGWSY